ncbi:MAG: hypothetical protein H6838_13590 [Planctomycetes bacterium]|nr:hypothetical protein [Planctomycetota bacterium]
MLERLHALSPAATFAFALVAADHLAAQCAVTPRPGLGTTGVGYYGVAPGAVRAATMWDPDGAGPATPVLVIAGAFRTAGNVIADHVAAIDPTTGAVQPLGSGFNEKVHALTVAANGDLVAAGQFTSAGSVAANYVARWNGSSWSALGTGPTPGPNSWCFALTALGNGDLVVGGQFTSAGGVPANLVARWNGTAWSSIGSLNSAATVRALATLPNGDLVAGGTLGLQRWNGTSWVPLGGGTNNHVHCLQLLANGDLLAGGEFTIAGGIPANHVARWDGSVWNALGAGTDDSVHSLLEMPGGDLVVGGDFANAGGQPASYAARWNGNAWAAFGNGMAYGLTFGDLPGVFALAALPGGDVFAGGVFRTADGAPASSMARWNGSAWAPLFAGTDGQVLDLVAAPGGGWYATGDFLAIGGVAANRVAWFDGNAWHALGQGLDGSGTSLLVLQNGDLVVGGRFLNAGGVPAPRIARWDGNSWHDLGGGMNRDVFTLAWHNGYIVAGGSFNIAGGVPAPVAARWDGAAWSTMGSLNAAVNTLLVDAQGTLFAGGYFSAPGTLGHVASWNGTAWVPLGNGIQPIVLALAAEPGGGLLAAGNGLALPNFVQRWNGSTWAAVGGQIGGVVHGLAALPNGDIVASGAFTQAGGAPASGLARWDGSTWTQLGGGLDGTTYDVKWRDDGELAVGGSFLTVGASGTAHFARLRSSCVAAATPLGAGCSSSIGPMQLTLDGLPWLGGNIASTTTGFAPRSFGVFEVGVTSLALPLVALHPAGGPGCMQWTGLDLVTELMLPGGSSASHAIALPNDPVFAGVVLHHQVGQVEFDNSGAITRLATSNAVTLTLGAF